VRLTVIGCAGGYPAPGVPTSGYLIDHGQTRIWCDLGPGTLTAFPGDLDSIDAVVVSHEHVDHCLDLLALFHALAYPLRPRGGVPVYGPRSALDKIAGFVAPSQTSLLDRTFDLVPIEDGSTVEVGPVRLAFAEATHPVPTVAMRFEAEGRSLAYTGDTGPEGEWTRLVDGADLFLCEATFVGTREQFPYPYHLNAGEAGSIGAAHGVGEMVVTHIPAHWDIERSRTEAEATFGRPIAMASPGASFEV
jgi:ribonuclease BN (tRNA processing enzyme)